MPGMISKKQLEEEFEEIGNKINLHEKEMADYSTLLADRPDFVKPLEHLNRIKELHRLTEVLFEQLEDKLQKNAQIFTRKEKIELLNKFKAAKNDFSLLFLKVNQQFSKLPFLIQMQKMRSFVAKANQLKQVMEESQENILVQKIVDIGDNGNSIEVNSLEDKLQALFVDYKMAFKNMQQLVQQYAKQKSNMFQQIAEDELNPLEKAALDKMGRELEDVRKFIADKFQHLNNWVEARKEIAEITTELLAVTKQAEQEARGLKESPSMSEFLQAKKVHKAAETLWGRLQNLAQQEATLMRLHEKEKKDLAWNLEIYRNKIEVLNHKILTAEQKNNKKEQQKKQLQDEFEKFSELASSLNHLSTDYIKRMDAWETIKPKIARDSIMKFQREFSFLHENYKKKLKQANMLTVAEKKSLTKTAEIYAIRKTIVEEIAKLNQRLQTYEKDSELRLEFGPKHAVLNLDRWHSIIDVLNRQGEGRLPVENPKVSFRSWIFGGEDTQVIRGDDETPLIAVTIRSSGWFSRAQGGISAVKLLTTTDESLAILGAMTNQLELAQEQGQVIRGCNLVGTSEALKLKARRLGENYYQVPAREIEVAVENSKNLREPGPEMPKLEQEVQNQARSKVVWDEESEGNSPPSPLLLQAKHRKEKEHPDKQPSISPSSSSKPPEI